MSGSGFVTMVINDGGTAVAVPTNSVQVVIGCASGGGVATAVPYSTNSPATLVANSGYGPAVEAAAMAIAAGATIIFILAAIATKGSATAPILSQGTGGSSGTSVVTTTIDGTRGAFDTYYVQMNVVVGGTIGTAGIVFQLSLDAGRNFGPQVSLGTATTYVIPNTGITLNFAAGTMVAGNFVKFSTVEPVATTAGIQACLTALAGSTFATGGWGSMHIVGAHIGADVQTINGYLDTASAPAFFTNGIYTRAIFGARDASPPTAWGGTGETEATWMASIQTDFSAVSAKRACVGAGHYNMPSAMGSGLGQGGSIAGNPSYRRPGAWAAAARRVVTQPQRLLSRVRDGSLSNIVQNPLVDPTDGFVYHDERFNPGLDSLISGSGTNRFMGFMTRQGKQGFYVSNPNLMSPSGSQYNLLPKGDVVDIFCGLLLQLGTNNINDDVRLTPTFTMNQNDAVAIQNSMKNTCDAQMTNVGMCTGTAVTVSQTAVIGGPSGPGQVPISGPVYGKGYILSETITVNLS